MTVLQFPKRVHATDLASAAGGVWTCGCEGQEWRLYGNGLVLCLKCNHISTVLKVIEDRLPPVSDDTGKSA
jgi:hypothetical protein